MDRRIEIKEYSGFDRGTSRPGLFPPMAVKSKPPAVGVVVDSVAFLVTK